MAASTTPRPSRKPPAAEGGGALIEALAPLAAQLPLAVAYSGGADSTALLHACRHAFPGQVAAIHVHHGLQAAADGFEAHCRLRCAELGLPLAVTRVDARPRRGQSPEEAARQARYSALAAAAAAGPIGALHCRTIVLAQHADDQAETLLLALTRGAGLPGLAAMRPRWQQAGLQFVRPWLACDAASLRQWLRDQGIGHVEDPSNGDESLTRNRIRARLLPALRQGFPAFLATFGRSAAHAAQAQALLDEVAQLDLQTAQPPGTSGPRIDWLRASSRARQSNLLRHWLSHAHGTRASSAQLNELLDQLAACSTRGHGIRIRVGTGVVERRGEVLAWYNSAPGRAAVE